MESLLEQLLEGQQKMTVDFNGKMDAMYTDLNGKFEALSIHQKKLETQIAQTAEAVKRQEGFLPGKTENPRGYVNAIASRSRAESNSELRESQEAENFESAEDDDEIAESISVSIDTSEHRSTPVQESVEDVSKQQVSIDTNSVSIDTYPEMLKETHVSVDRVHKPKKQNPTTPRHLREPISPKQLLGFEKMVRRIPHTLSFEEALEYRPLLSHFRGCRETIEEIEALFIKARGTPPLRQLTKRKDPGKFMVPCSISGVEFKDAFVDSGSCVNVMTREIAERLGADIQPPNMTLTYANASTSLPYGTIPDLLVKVGDCLVPTDFQVVEMNARSTAPLILGRPFMATVGAVIDTPSKTISFSYIDKEVSYRAIPTGEPPTHASCITVIAGEALVNDLLDMPPDKPTVTDVLDGPPIIAKKEIRTAKSKKKVKNRRVESASRITLTPRVCDGDAIEYRVKCKGTSKPFSKARVILTSELKEKGKDFVDGMLSRTLKLEMSGCGAYFGVSSQQNPD